MYRKLADTRRPPFSQPSLDVPLQLYRHTVRTWIRYRFRLPHRRCQDSTHYLDLRSLREWLARMRASVWSQCLHLGDPRAPHAKANRSIRSATREARQRQRGDIGTLRSAKQSIPKIDGAPCSAAGSLSFRLLTRDSVWPSISHREGASARGRRREHHPLATCGGRGRGTSYRARQVTTSDGLSRGRRPRRG